tara:strand:+ start:1075 stop:1776 length:702 start_codon:yes stop_codon:yes gene_type:complete
MARYSPELLYQTMNDVQETIGGLSQTSQFMVSMNFSERDGLRRHLRDCRLLGRTRREAYRFLCSDATLPGSSFDVMEESGTRQGVIERFANRRIYTEFDLTFYVDRKYNTIRLFEEWMNWIDPLFTDNDEYEGSPEGQVGREDRTGFYRLKYPNAYKMNIDILKFERGFKKKPNKVTSKLFEQHLLKYTFVDAFPKNIQAIPLSYQGSEITKVSVSFDYTRYIVIKQLPNNRR